MGSREFQTYVKCMYLIVDMLEGGHVIHSKLSPTNIWEIVDQTFEKHQFQLGTSFYKNASGGKFPCSRDQHNPKYVILKLTFTWSKFAIALSSSHPLFCKQSTEYLTVKPVR